MFYSKKFKGTGSWKEEGEVDFVIFDGSKTLLCMEVKGGRIAFDGVEDVWLQNDKVLSPQPDRQATEGMRALFSFLERDVSQLNCGWILGFPHCSLPDDFQPPSRIPKAVIVDQAGFTGIEAAIRKAERYYVDHYKKPGINPLTAKTITGRLTRSVEFINKVGVRVARDSQQLIQVTEEQYRILEDLEINPKIAVRGFAGTGKTVLAAEFAKRLATNGHRTLLLFFNRMIANNTRRSFDRDLPVDCTTFHSFARRVIDEHEPGWWQAKSKEKRPEFWEMDVPLKLLETPTDQLEKYDAIIVDEGQDFRPEWYEYLETLLTDKDQSRFVVFYDEGQDLFDRWSELPWGGSGVARKQLKENCRNTRSIVSFLNEKYPTEMTPCSFSPQGEEVIERRAETQQEAKDLFVGDVSNLLRQGIRPGQMITLLDKPKRESCLADVTKFGSVKFESLARYYDEGGRSVSFTTINTFKGMEADVVFFFLEDGPDHTKLENQLYVEGSRARAMLYVYTYAQSI